MQLLNKGTSRARQTAQVVQVQPMAVDEAAGALTSARMQQLFPDPPLNSSRAPFMAP